MPKELTVRDFEEKLKIDRDDLDSALMEQAHNFYLVSEKLSYAISQRDDCKLELERKSADLDKQFREKLAKNEQKVTDTAVRAEIESAPAYKKLRDELLDLQREVGSWSALKEAFGQRSMALKDLANLYAANYFTRSSVKAATGRRDEGDAAEVREVAGKRRRQRRGED